MLLKIYFDGEYPISNAKLYKLFVLNKKLQDLSNKNLINIIYKLYFLAKIL